jgi:hypothetical protein
VLGPPVAGTGGDIDLHTSADVTDVTQIKVRASTDPPADCTADLNEQVTVTLVGPISAPTTLCADSRGYTASVPTHAGMHYAWSIASGNGTITSDPNDPTIQFDTTHPGPALTLQLTVTNGADSTVCVRTIPLDPGCIHITPGEDLFKTPGTPSGSATDYEFSNTPLPAGFFDPGSEPFDGTVQLQGAPLITNPPAALGPTDTIVRRLGSVDLTPGGTQVIPIEIVSLSLVSCQPITVRYTSSPLIEHWNVSVCLSDIVPQPQGSMTIRRAPCAEPRGGTFDSTLPVRPHFTFTRVDPLPGAVRELDGGVIPFQILDGHWLADDPGGLGLVRSSVGIAVTPCGSNPPVVLSAASDFLPGLRAQRCPVDDCGATPTIMMRMVHAHASAASLGVLPASSCTADADNDGVCDVADNCATNFNSAQADVDDDGVGDGCDPCDSGCDNSGGGDSDSDGVLDCADACPNDPERSAPGTCGCGNGLDELWLSVQLDVLAGPVTRAIQVELADCNGHRANVCVEIPFGADGRSVTEAGLPSHMRRVVLPPGSCRHYQCVSIEDGLHTLRRQMDVVADALHNVYRADFVAQGASGVLSGGDLFNDNVVDILDFGTYVSLFGHDYGSGDTTCATASPHADIDGDGIVFTGDFTFIFANFLRTGDGPCCPGRLDIGHPPLESITVAELGRRGLMHLSVADLNHDGVVDMNDVVAFLAGARPGTPPPDGTPQAGPASPDGPGPGRPVRRRP